jgi:hypothetical protein
MTVNSSFMKTLITLCMSTAVVLLVVALVFMLTSRRRWKVATGAACANKQSKQTWITAQTGRGVISDANVAVMVGDKLVKPSGWEGDSGDANTPVPANTGCVLAGLKDKDGNDLPGQGQIFPYGVVWPAGESGPKDLCEVYNISKPCARGVNGLDPSLSQHAPTALKNLLRSTKPPRTALYHGGIVGNAQSDLAVYGRYMAQIIKFVQYRGINRMFFVVTPWDSKNQPFFSDVTNVVNAIVVPLYQAYTSKPTQWIDSERPSLGIVPYLRPKDGVYNVLDPTTGKPPTTPQFAGGLCSVCTDSAECEGHEIKTSQLSTPENGTTCSKINPSYGSTRVSSISPGSKCLQPCTYAPDPLKPEICVGCEDSASCGAATGCPNNADQVMYWVQLLNAAIRACEDIPVGEREHWVIRNWIMDGEDAGVWQEDWGMVQIAQNAWRRGGTTQALGAATMADVTNIGFAKGISATPTDAIKKIQSDSNVLGVSQPPDSTSGGSGQWTYMPETYWYMDELAPCSGNPYELSAAWAGDGSASDVSNPNSTICTTETSYRKFARTFRGHGAAADQTSTAWMYMRYLESASAGPFDGEMSEPQRFHGVTNSNEDTWQESIRGIQQLADNVRKAGKTTTIVPLLSFENLSATRAPAGKLGLPNDSTRDCLALNYFGKTGGPKPDLCGTFDGFAYWDWDDFAEFMWIFSDYARFAKLTKNYAEASQDTDVRGWVGLYEAQFIPSQWMPGGKFTLDDGTLDDADRWSEHWRFDPKCSSQQFTCGKDSSNPDAECAAYAKNPDIIKSLNDNCPAAGSDPGWRFDPESFGVKGSCNVDGSKPVGTTFYCNVNTKFHCENDGMCLNGGTCNNGVCTCNPPWTGTDCTARPNDCNKFESDKCINAGICTADSDPSKPSTCECPAGFTGLKCETKYDVNKNACYAHCQTNIKQCDAWCRSLSGPNSFCNLNPDALTATCHGDGDPPACKKCNADPECDGCSVETTGICDNGFCTCKTTACQSNVECPIGSTCQQGVCVTASACTTSTDCPNDTPLCSGGVCASCTDDEPCHAGTYCIQGKCVSASGCVTSNDCPYDNGMCIGGQCGACVPCKVNASGNDPCSARTDGRTICEQGVCVTPAPSPRCDMSINANAYCAAIGGGYCVNDKNCHGEGYENKPCCMACDTAAQCPETWVCASGQCAPPTKTPMIGQLGGPMTRDVSEFLDLHSTSFAWI